MSTETLECTAVPVELDLGVKVVTAGPVAAAWTRNL
jgi:hypothetical protein